MTSFIRSRHTPLAMTSTFVLRLSVVVAAVLALNWCTVQAREIPLKQVSLDFNQVGDNADKKQDYGVKTVSNLPSKVSIPLDALADKISVKDEDDDISDSDGKKKKLLKKAKWAKKRKMKKQKKRKQNKRKDKKNKNKKKEMMKIKSEKNRNMKNKKAKKAKNKKTQKMGKKSEKYEVKGSDEKVDKEKIQQKIPEMNDFKDIAELFIDGVEDDTSGESESESRSVSRKSGSLQEFESSESSFEGSSESDDDDDDDDDDDELDSSDESQDSTSQESSASKDSSSVGLFHVDGDDNDNDIIDDSSDSEGDDLVDMSSIKSRMRVRRSAKRGKKKSHRSKGKGKSHSKKSARKSKHKPKSAHKHKPKPKPAPKPKSVHKPKPKPKSAPKPKSVHKPKPKPKSAPKPKSVHKPKPKPKSAPKPKSVHKPKPKPKSAPKPKSVHKPKPKPKSAPKPKTPKVHKPKSVAKPEPRPIKPAVQPRPAVLPRPKGTVKRSHGTKKYKSHSIKKYKSHGTKKYKSHGTKKHKSHGHTKKHKSHGTKKHKSHGHTKKHKSHGHTKKHKSHGHTKKHKSHSPKKVIPKPAPPAPKPRSPISKSVRRKIDMGLRWKKRRFNSMCECQASGDPHYRTFDGSMIHFMGTCEYTLVKSLTKHDTCGFEVTVGNEHRYGQTRVSYTRMLRLRMFGIEVIIYKGKRVVINGVRQFPPIYLDKRMTIVQNWRDVSVVTQCGVEISFKDDHMAKILVPKRYAGKLSGICGDCDGKAWNDFRLANGSWVIKNADKDALIGRSYAVETLSDPRQAGCETKQVSTFACPDQFKTAAERVCQDVINNAGPFKDCLKSLRSQSRMYYDNCLQDVCAAMGDGITPQRAACKSMEAFSDQCLHSGIFTNWRTAERCPINCPINSHYSAAVSACPPSCVTPEPRGPCTIDLVPGCECNEGYILDNRQCVPKGRCGCLDERNDYIPVNTTFRSRDCKQTFRCQVAADGRTTQIVAVETKACGRFGRCVLKRGVRMCRCRRGYEGDGYDCTSSREERDRQREIFRKQIELRKKRKLELCECTGSGDPHYRTFDGQMIHFQGSCTYTLSKSVESMRNGSCTYDVSVTNEHRNNNNRVAFTRSVFVGVKGVRIGLLHGLKLMVNGKTRYAPVVIPELDVKIVRSGQMMEVIVSSCGLEVAFDGRHRVEVRVPKTMGRSVTGICGNCNGKQDDFTTKDGIDVSRKQDKYSLIGNSYLVADDTMLSTSKAAKCRHTPPPVTCDPESLTSAGSANRCGRLTDPRGPFAACARAMRNTVTEIFDSCVLDLCSFVGQSDVESEVTCMAYETLAGMCEASGISVRWRTSEICPLPCPANSRYNPLMSGCQSTCLGPAPEICELNQREGCECEEGFVLDAGKCVLLEDCGCRDSDNDYFPIGSSVTSDDCRTVTSCRATRLGSMLETLVQFPDGCASGAECVSVQGERLCRCSKGFTGDGIECVPGATTPSAIVAITQNDMVPQPTMAVLFPTRKPSTPPTPQVDPTPPPPTPQPPTPQPPAPKAPTTLAGPPAPTPPAPTPQPPTPQPPTPPPPTPPPVTLPGPIPPPTTPPKRATPPPPTPPPQQPTPAPPTPPAPTPPPPGPNPLAVLPQVVDDFTFVATPPAPRPAQEPCECRATGDPHYRTFDGARLEIYDSCKYIMAETLSSDFPCAFRVEVKNEKRPNSDHPGRSYTRLVDIRLPTDTIRLHRGGKIYFNGQEMAPGFTNGKITIIFDGTWTNVSTACGLNVSFDGDKKAVVRMSGGYRGTTKGLCGNCDGDVENDVTVDGRFVFTFDTIMEGYHKLASQFLIADDSDKPDTSTRCEPPLHPYGYKDKK